MFCARGKESRLVLIYSRNIIFKQTFRKFVMIVECSERRKRIEMHDCMIKVALVDIW